MQIGIDESEVIYEREKSKSIGNSVTLAENVSNIETLKRIVHVLTEQVTFRLRQENLYAKVVNVQLRTADFKDFSHQMKLEIATSSTQKIYEKAKLILSQMYKSDVPIRLVGVRVDNLVNEIKQISIFSEKEEDNVDKILDELKNKYGYSSIIRANEIGIQNLVNVDKFKSSDT